mmetsp:Transcript_126/g.292  ORF Transcript_126/g.292 Transcript_126/m.292 type:complete len:84 (-) Transcript_126:217-468(-)
MQGGWIRRNHYLFRSKSEIELDERVEQRCPAGHKGLLRLYRTLEMFLGEIWIAQVAAKAGDLARVAAKAAGLALCFLSPPLNQ